ncbi:phosphatidylglycerophosphate synthase [Friedmanniella endophytica]|uniref:Phosphatidylglycerophosphate synthase n=1 Tax=Microlunatus kandeliicorticis TaxID=1759536 RepID=A0A7W3IP61_9ACTN|nr:CDP-alcohol phosphatidyltransferase family protein [Microlunatus kandeliicorticis]MBA8792664.1 phosphatidylglycerophosphate synthase [Microlunatus kandeliicorticis]
MTTGVRGPDLGTREETDAEGFGAALRRLRQAQKSPKGAPFYSLWVNRPLGRVFAALMYTWGRTPNQVTAISACFTFAALVAVALVPPGPLAGVLIGLGLVVGYALDSADGQVARLRGGGSVTGEWLDHVIDSVKNGSLHLAVAIGFYRFVLPEHPALDPWWLLVPLGFSVVAGVHFAGMLLTEQLSRARRISLGMTAVAPGTTPRWMSLAKLPTDYGVLCLSFVLLGAPLVFATVYTVLAVASAGYLVLVLGKWYRDLRALDRTAAAGSAP